MSKKNEKEKKSNNNSKEKDYLNMITSNITKPYLILNNQKIKRDNSGNKKCVINYEEIKDNDEEIVFKTRKRNNSVDLYKKRKRKKEKKKAKESYKNLKLDNTLNNISINLYSNINKKSNKSDKYLITKKVNFAKNFVTFYDVESYKRFNAKNTFEDKLFQNYEEEKTNCTCLIS